PRSRRSNERLPARAVRIPTKWIVDCRRSSRRGGRDVQISCPKTHGRNADAVRVCLVVEDFQVVRKEKELVLFDRAAKVAAKVVVGQVTDSRVEEIAGVEITVPVKFIGGAVVIVGARLQDDVSDGSAGTPEFGFEVARGNVDRLNCFERRNENLQQACSL